MEHLYRSRIPEFGIARENEERRDGGCGVIFDPATQRYAVGQRNTDGLMLLFGGGVSEDEPIEQGVLREVEEESGLHDFLHVEHIAEALTHYHNAAKKVNRVAHARCFLLVLNSTVTKPTKLEAHEDFSLAWTTPEELIAHWNEWNSEKEYDHWIYFMEKGKQRAQELGYDHSIF